jgi:IclR family transcriptional regulator, KDG regulon repressor
VKPSRSLLRGLQVLEAVVEANRPIGPTQVAETVGLDKATASRHLHTLHSAGYLRSAGSSGRYLLSAKLLRLASSEAGHDVTRRVADPYLSEMRDRTQETVHLGVVEDGRVVYIDKFDAPLPIRLASAIGQSNPIHTTALGKAYAASLTVEARAVLVAEARELPTDEKGALDQERFMRELKEVRARGYATDQEENEKGVCCVGAPILDHLGRPIAAVSISGPAYRMAPRLDEFGRDCLDTARRVSAEVGAASSPRSSEAGPSVAESPPA